MSCKSVLDTSFLRLFQVDTNHLCQHREETWVIIRQRGTSEGKVLRCGKSAGLNIQIVENLQVIRDKSSRTYNHPFDPLRGKLLQDLYNTAPDPGFAASPSALPTTSPATP